MCELFAMSASAPVHARYDLDRFAAEGGERHQNRDGWGIMFAERRDAQCFREAAAASDSPLDRFVRDHETPHATVLAHVRRASVGGCELANTHPFRRVRHGRVHHFAHNGTLPGIEAGSQAKALVPDRVGDTDSELAFLILLDLMKQQDPDPSDVAARFDLFCAFARWMAHLGPANFLWFDGAVLFVHADRRAHETPQGLTPPRPPGLHVLRSVDRSLGCDHECSGARLRQLPDHVVLFASVPLSDAAWEPMPARTAVAVRNGQIVHQETCS